METEQLMLKDRIDMEREVSMAPTYEAKQKVLKQMLGKAYIHRMAEITRKKLEVNQMAQRKYEDKIKRQKIEHSLAKNFILKAPEHVSIQQLEDNVKGYKKENTDYYQAVVISHMEDHLGLTTRKLKRDYRFK